MTGAAAGEAGADEAGAGGAEADDASPAGSGMVFSRVGPSTTGPSRIARLAMSTPKSCGDGAVFEVGNAALGGRAAGASDTLDATPATDAAVRNSAGGADIIFGLGVVTPLLGGAVPAMACAAPPSSAGVTPIPGGVPGGGGPGAGCKAAVCAGVARGISSFGVAASTIGMSASASADDAMAEAGVAGVLPDAGASAGTGASAGGLVGGAVAAACATDAAGRTDVACIALSAWSGAWPTRVGVAASIGTGEAMAAGAGMPKASGQDSRGASGACIRLSNELSSGMAAPGAAAVAAIASSTTASRQSSAIRIPETCISLWPVINPALS